MTHGEPLDANLLFLNILLMKFIWSANSTRKLAWGEVRISHLIDNLL